MSEEDKDIDIESDVSIQILVFCGLNVENAQCDM